MEKINRDGLQTLVLRGYTMQTLADAFALSRVWATKIIFSNREPKHPGVTRWINEAIERLLTAQ